MYMSLSGSSVRVISLLDAQVVEVWLTLSACPPHNSDVDLVDFIDSCLQYEPEVRVGR